ncbi:hypothetical protein IEQ34_022840 [Dendrobium chrysotoxum]|uniref:Uncharacterized protein n=1 Tax=Dendrobium chrysotoxum TaxID=161865 RepID=A0AAV7FK96_DENCH|nr:hypothetical protein IEQ34_022840 [Dendrobium chrysotoxum]
MEDYTHLRTVLFDVGKSVVSLSADCTKRIHTLDNKLDDLSKLLGKMLSLCLEEAAVVAKLAYQTQIFRINEERYQLILFSIFRLCTRCIQNALCDSNRQVQAIGLNFLKIAEISRCHAIARRLVGHLIHIPSSATQLKDVMLSMPGFRRTTTSASVAQDQTMTTKINIESDIKARGGNQLHESTVMAAQTLKHEEQDAAVDKNYDDDDDDWDAFQSLPAENPTAPTFDTHVERTDSQIATITDSSVIQNAESEYPSDTQNTERNASEETREPGANSTIDATDSKAS